jgi:DNA-binding NtrC family response regulator
MENKKELKIFVTDDDVYTINLYEQYLRNFGIEDIKLFSNGTDCLNNINLKPDIIFLDYNMGLLSGFDVLKKIKKRNSDIYIVMVSGQENMDTAVNTLMAGAFEYITKGDYVAAQMKKVIEKILVLKSEDKHNDKSLFHRLFHRFFYKQQ